MATLTNRAAVSEVVNDLRALGMDDHISYRYILAKLRGFAAIFIKREADLRRLYKSSDVWFTVPCVEMKPAKVSDCCNVSLPFCTSFMKSVKKLPETYSTNFGNVIREVSSINNTVNFEQVTPRQFQAIGLREYRSRIKKYYWIENDYIIIPESDVEVIKITAAFKSAIDAKRFSSCYNEALEACASPLEQPFLCPEYLWEVVRQEAVKDLFSFYKRNILDAYPDDNTNNKQEPKTSQPQ